MIGQKGIPATHGGVERHVEELAKRLVIAGHKVVVYTRPNYTDPSLDHYHGITLVSLPTIGTKHLDAIVHCALCAIDSRRRGLDIVHFHAIGPTLTLPIALRRGVAAISTIHAQDWRREKWGGLASLALRAGEWMALHAASATICVSQRLAGEYAESGSVDVNYIPNGIAVSDGDDTTVLEEHGLADGGYLLFAGRIVPEKGAHYLIDAWLEAGRPLPLVVAGDTSYSDEYLASLRAHEAEGVIFTGYEYGDRLAALFRHAALFVLPSDLEGLPIVLLEALEYGCPVLASDIAPNQEVLGDNGSYFRAGSASSLCQELQMAIADLDARRQQAQRLREAAAREYDWDRIAKMTLEVYSSALTERLRGRGD